MKVLDAGHVELVDHMGSDLTVANAARVSFGGGTEVSHLLTVGYSSIAELESWEDPLQWPKGGVF